MVTIEERVSNLEGRFESLATKADVERLGGELRAEIGELRGEIGELRGEFRGEIGKLRGELRAEMGEMRGEIKALRILMMSAIGVMGLALAGLNVILQLVG